MQRRFTECRINANVKLCFVIGQCHGNSALFDIGIGATCTSNVVHKVPSSVDVSSAWHVSGYFSGVGVGGRVGASEGGNVRRAEGLKCKYAQRKMAGCEVGRTEGVGRDGA